MNSELLQGFYLGDLLIEPLKGQVTGRSGAQHLPPKAVEVLICLAKHSGQLVEREALLSDVWGPGNGSQEGLGHAISEIRHALDDHPDNPEFIQTLPKRGYRLIVTPTPLSDHGDSIILGAQNGSRSPDIGLFEDLQRRGVLETALAYLVVGWLLIQIADIVFAQLHLPDWTGTFVTVLVIAGFPLTIALSWFLELRDGQAVLDDLSPGDRRRRRFSRTYFSVIGALAAASVLVFAYDQVIGLPEADPEGVAVQRTADSATEPLIQRDLIPVVENSIAVLRLLNIDGDAKTEAFGAGLAEDILDGLARIPGLRVSSRGDSWSLPPNTASNVVQRRLRVASYIEGSVRYSNGVLKVVIQLIDTRTGFHLFSRNFELETEDIADMQRTVTNLVVSNLQIAVDPDVVDSFAYYSSNKDEDAYYSYLLGREAIARPRSVENLLEAIQHFDHALSIDAQYPAAHAGRCSAFVAFYVMQQDTNNISLAESACGKALAVAPNLPLVLNSLASLYRHTGRTSEAETLYRELLNINPQSVSALQGLALLHRRAQRFDEAEMLMRKAIELQPGNWLAINGLGNMYFRMGRYVEAIGEYRKVVFLDPSNFVVMGNLASANLMIGDFETARDALKQSIAIKETDTFYSNLGIVHYYLGEFSQAVAAHRRAVELAPSSGANWLGLADALYYANERDQAHDAYEKVVELARKQLAVDAQDAESMTFLAWSLAMTGSHDDAVTFVDRAVAVDPADPYSHYFRALVLTQSGDLTQALRSVDEAMRNGYPVAMLLAEPILKELRSDSRFLDLLESTGN